MSEILSDFTAAGHARPRQPLATDAQAAEWRRLARSVGRRIRRPVRTYDAVDGPIATLNDWPADDVERDIQARNVRATVDAMALAEAQAQAAALPERKGPGRPRTDSGPGARNRMLAAARHLFTTYGFRASGVDTITEEAGVAKATFYKYFSSRSDLEVTYLDMIHQEEVGDLAHYESIHSQAADVLTDVIDAATAGFAGAPAANVFVLALVEYPTPDHPARDAARAHLDWRHRQLTRLFTSAGHPRPEDAAADFAAALDGAELLAHARDRETAAGTARRALARLLAETT